MWQQRVLWYVVSVGVKVHLSVFSFILVNALVPVKPENQLPQRHVISWQTHGQSQVVDVLMTDGEKNFKHVLVMMKASLHLA